MVAITRRQTFGIRPPPAKKWLKWHQGYYNEDHKGWKETELQCYMRAQPSRDKTAMLKDRHKQQRGVRVPLQNAARERAQMIEGPF